MEITSYEAAEIRLYQQLEPFLSPKEAHFNLVGGSNT
mgnify:CR=1 FL=1